MQRHRRSTVDSYVTGVTVTLHSDTLISRDSHENAPPVVIRRDQIQKALWTLRSESGLDDCSHVATQKSEGRSETASHATADLCERSDHAHCHQSRDGVEVTPGEGCRTETRLHHVPQKVLLGDDRYQ